jgi:FixJ family two-component response regulator
LKTANLTKAAVISIIDDDHGMREAMRSLVRSLGYDAQTFSSAEDYLRSGARGSECLVLDVNMPGMSGADLQQRLIASGDNTPVIFMTAFADEKVRTRTLKAGACGFLRKPFDDTEFIDCLERALIAH